MSKHDRPLEKFLTGYGYEAGEYDAHKKQTVWVKHGKPDVVVKPNVKEHAFRAIAREVDKLHGKKSVKAVRKRNVSAIKERQQSEREKLAAQVEKRKAELAEYERAIDDRLGVLTTSEWDLVCREIERREREIREIEKLMTEIPSSSANRGSGQPRHVSKAMPMTVR